VKELVIGRPGNPFEELEDVKFKERYRLSKNAVYRLLQEIMFTIPCYTAIIVYKFIHLFHKMAFR